VAKQTEQRNVLISVGRRQTCNKRISRGELLSTFPVDELWQQERSSMGSHKETAHVPAALKRYVDTFRPKLASLR